MTRTYITGLGRANSDYGLLEETHIYEVVGNSLLPLCSRGFNREHGDVFSIFRGNVGNIGVCQVCEGRERKNRAGLGWKRSRKLKKKIGRTKGYSPLIPGLPLVPPPHYFPKDQWSEEDGEE